MQNNLVSLGHEITCGRETQSVGGTRDEAATHVTLQWRGPSTVRGAGEAECEAAGDEAAQYFAAPEAVNVGVHIKCPATIGNSRSPTHYRSASRASSR